MIYDGFFDAELTTEGYDRAYDAQDFTAYFAHFIGSGVCVANNADSLLVSFADGAAVVAPGYLFLGGRWLKNGADYTIPLTVGSWAILAQLNTAQRTISLLAAAQGESYPDALCLALVTLDASGTATVQDTRADAALCGVIEAAGALNAKVRYAVDYIDNQVEGRLERAEQSITEEIGRMEQAIAEAEEEVEKLAPPPVGSVKYAAADPGEKWLRCDGSFVGDADYPALVALLRKNSPGTVDLRQIYSGSMGAVLSGTVLYNGALWIYAADTRTISKINVTDGTRTDVAVTFSGGSAGADLDGVNAIALSIANGKLFLSQLRERNLTMYWADAPTGSSVTMTYLSGVSSISATGTFVAAAPRVYPSVVYDETAGNYRVAVRIIYQTEQSWYRQYYLIGGRISADGSTVSTSYDNLTAERRNDYSDAGVLRPNGVIAYSDRNGGKLVYNEIVSSNTVLALVTTPGGTSVAAGTTPSAAPEAAGTIPVLNSAAAVMKAVISDGTLYALAADIVGDTAPMRGGSTGLAMPDLAQTFPESLAYLTSQKLAVAFVGTGIAFSRTPSVLTSWGYIDLREQLGAIVASGGCIASGSDLLLYGVSRGGDYVLARLSVTSSLAQAEGGAFLPLLSADGIPGYIKALEG